MRPLQIYAAVLFQKFRILASDMLLVSFQANMMVCCFKLQVAHFSINCLNWSSCGIFGVPSQLDISSEPSLLSKPFTVYSMTVTALECHASWQLNHSKKFNLSKLHTGLRQCVSLGLVSTRFRNSAVRGWIGMGSFSTAHGSKHVPTMVLKEIKKNGAALPMIAKDPFPHLPTPFTIIVLLSSSHHLLPWTCVWYPSRLC